MECGVGPICRKLDNALLALLIQGDVMKAEQTIWSISPHGLPEVVQDTFGKARTTISEVRGEHQSKGWSKFDFRATVKRIEWVLSHDLKIDDRKALINTVWALGYVGLAALWMGDAATGKATITFEGGRLYLKGPKNKAGRTALKAIPGWKFHPETKMWSVPAAKSEAFNLAIITYWPNWVGLASAVAEAQAYTFEHAAPVVPEKLAGVASEKVTITQKGATLEIKSPYSQGFVATLKEQIPWQQRKWNQVRKAWEVDAAFLSTVILISRMSYQGAEIEVR